MLNINYIFYNCNIHCICIYTIYDLCCAVLSLQLCPTLCNPMDCSPPGFSVLRILQARRLPFPSPGDLPDPGIEPGSPALAGRFFSTSATWEVPYI